MSIPDCLMPSDSILGLIKEDYNAGIYRLYDLSAVTTRDQVDPILCSDMRKDGLQYVFSESKSDSDNGMIDRFNQLRTLMYAYSIMGFAPVARNTKMNLGVAMSYAERFLVFAQKSIPSSTARVSAKALSQAEIETRAWAFSNAVLSKGDDTQLGNFLLTAVEDKKDLWCFKAEDSRIRKRNVQLTPRKRTNSWRWTKDSDNSWSSGTSTSDSEIDFSIPKRRKLSDSICDNKRIPDQIELARKLSDNSKNDEVKSSSTHNIEVNKTISSPSKGGTVSFPPSLTPFFKNKTWRPQNPLESSEDSMNECWHWVKIAKEIDWSNHEGVPLLRLEKWPHPHEAELRLGRNVFKNGFIKTTPEGFKPSRHRFIDGINTRIFTGRQPTGNARPPLVPRDLPKEKYLEHALKVLHPMIEGPEFDPELKIAIKFSAKADASLNELREKRTYTLRQMAEALTPEKQAWAKALPDSLKIVEHIHMPLQWAILSALQYSDIFFAYDHTHGKTIAGRACHSFLWHRKDRVPTDCIGTLNKEWEERNKITIGQVKPNPDPLCDKMGFEKTMKEFKTGHMIGPYNIEEVPLDSFIITRRKCIRQGFDEAGNPKFRNVDDFTASGINATAEAAESYIPEGFENALAMLCQYSDNSADPESLVMEGYVADYATAFRQDPVRPDQQNLVVIAFWNPILKKVQAGIMRGHPFGAALSPQNFARIPESMCFIARKLLFLPIAHYSDDNYCFEKQLVVKSGWEAWRDINDIMGWILGEPGSEKFPLHSLVMKLLGVKLTFSQGLVTISIDPDKVANISESLANILRNNILTPGHSGQLAGKLQFISNAFAGQYGKHFLRPLIQRQYQPHVWSTRLNAGLKGALKWWKLTLVQHPPRPLPLQRSLRRRLVIFGDGEGSGSIGAIAFHFAPGSTSFTRPRAFQLDLPQSLRDSWGQAKQKINQIEAVVPLICLLTFREWAKDSMYCHYIDNTSALATMVRGSSNKESLGSIADLTWNLIAKEKCFAWFEWVPTKANVSDGISRRNFSDPWNLNWELVSPTVPLEWKKHFPPEAKVSFNREHISSFPS